VLGDNCTAKLVAGSADEFVSDIAEDIQRFLAETHKTEKFNKKDEGHLMLLMSDFLDLFLILKESEIHEYLSMLGITLASSRLTQYLFVCEKLELIERLDYSGGRYLLRTESTSLLSYSTKPAIKLRDRLKIKAAAQSYYESQDKKRIRALRRYREST
jgi:hypothetical protein